ncbi:hypothetical protein [Azospirillum sp. B2RO_4]|uniref:hypothetical protein n=1 Tax=Azospirillum sp. B2RO_4 TaxID=3027796 RepID=UPI003DA95FCF
MEMYGVKGFPDGADIPTVALQVRALSLERAVQLAAARPIAAGLRLEALHIGGALKDYGEGVRYEGPWPWPGRSS